MVDWGTFFRQAGRVKKPFQREIFSEDGMSVIFLVYPRSVQVSVATEFQGVALRTVALRRNFKAQRASFLILSRNVVYFDSCCCFLFSKKSPDLPSRGLLP